MAIYEVRLKWMDQRNVDWSKIRPISIRCKKIETSIQRLFEDNFQLEEVRYSEQGNYNGSYLRRSEVREEKRMDGSAFA